MLAHSISTTYLNIRSVVFLYIWLSSAQDNTCSYERTDSGSKQLLTDDDAKLKQTKN